MKHQKSLVILFLFINLFSFYAQISIKGKVIDENFHAFPSVKIFINDTVQIGKTDFNGNFEINTSIELNKLTFSSLGYENTNISLSNDCNYLEVILLEDSNYHFSSNKVERIRKKRFNKLKEKHLAAFRKGAFIKKSACYISLFESYKPESDQIAREMKLIKKQIKTLFKELRIGDNVKIPIKSWSAYTDEIDFGCLITTTIIEKNKKKGSYNLILKVTENICNKFKTANNRKPIKLGELITYNMKYFKVITE